MAREIRDDEGLRHVMESASTLAVIGMKPPGGGPAYTVPKLMQRKGRTIIPVNPKHERIDDLECFDTVDAIDQDVDMVVLFRASYNVGAHVDEILAMEPLPDTVWMQLGIRNAGATRRLVEAGIDVVQDRCLAIEYPRLVK
jgi:predicted CoA-binding protein